MTTSGKKNTVALLGASGHLGAETLKSLVVAADEGKIILIVLHRRTSDTSNVPPGIEKRILDANNAEFPEVEAALKGIDVLVSTAQETPEGGIRFVDNLAKLPKGQLKVYIPSYFTANWDPSEENDTDNVFVHEKSALHNRAIALGLPITTVACGLFESSFLNEAFFGLDVPNNTLSVYGDALDRRFSFASLPFLGEAVAQIVLSPGFGPGEWHTVVEQEFTGREVVAAFEAVNGSKPQIKVFTDADVDEKRKQGPVWGLGASWRVHWGRGLWKVVNLFEPRGVERRTLEQAVREAKGGADSEKPAEQPKAPAAVSSGRSRLSGDDGGLTGHVAKHSGDDIGHAVKQPVRVK